MQRHDPIEVGVERGDDGQVRQARIRFGPHYAAEVRSDGERVSFSLVATHHGFAADATEVGGELELILTDVRRLHPERAVD